MSVENVKSFETGKPSKRSYRSRQQCVRQLEVASKLVEGIAYDLADELDSNICARLILMAAELQNVSRLPRFRNTVHER